MRYTINKTNYRDFGKFSENRLEHRSYFIPFLTVEAMRKTDWFTERAESDAIIMLSGELCIIRKPRNCLTDWIRTEQHFKRYPFRPLGRKPATIRSTI